MPDYTVTDEEYNNVYSTEVFGKYVHILGNRCWKGNIILDPRDTKEIRPSWIAYSRLDEPDIIPVSNVIKLIDNEGGPITGLNSLGGRLVVFKRQAVYILSKDFSDTENMILYGGSGVSAIKEASHNIGNIAVGGVIGIPNRVYFVYYDGIYEATEPDIDSANSPHRFEKISAHIEDKFLAMSEANKKLIRGTYDSIKNEVIFHLPTVGLFSYHVKELKWREISTSESPDIFIQNDRSEPGLYDLTDNKFRIFDDSTGTAKESVATEWISKKFPLSMRRKKGIRNVSVQADTVDAHYVDVYLNDSTSANTTKTIGASVGNRVNKVPIKRKANSFRVGIRSADTTNDFKLERVQIETE